MVQFIACEYIRYCQIDRKEAIEMIEAEEKEYVSVFAGSCQSRELLEEYLFQQHQLLNFSPIRSVFEKDFHFKYDERDLFHAVNARMSNNVEEIFANVKAFDMDWLKQEHSDCFDRFYNAAIVIKNYKYQGEVKEITNEKFGYFKFFGVYPLKRAEVIIDYGNTYRNAIYKLIQWGYKVSRVQESADFNAGMEWLAQKDQKIYTAENPLRLLGLITIIREYGENWEHSDVARTFSIKPALGELDYHEWMWGKILDPEQIEEE